MPVSQNATLPRLSVPLIVAAVASKAASTESLQAALSWGTPSSSPWLSMGYSAASCEDWVT